MDINRISVLQELYDSLLQDRKQVNDIINNNINRIEEINAFLNSVKDDPESDMRVFSPRSSEAIYRDEINVHEEEKENIEKENHSQYYKLSKLTKQIEDIEFLLKDLSSIELKNENSFIVDNVLDEKENLSEYFSDDSKHMWMLDIQEKERQRIARELHDSSVQNLTHLIHMIELSSMFIDQDPIRAKLELASCSKNLKSVIDEIRETIFNLRPMSFDDLGFKQSIDDLITKLKSNYNFEAGKTKSRQISQKKSSKIDNIVKQISIHVTRHMREQSLQIKTELYTENRRSLRPRVSVRA